MIELTIGESMLLKRRRLGLNQTDMAKLLGTTRQKLSLIELDKLEIQSPNNYKSIISKTEIRDDNEYCVICRHRYNMTQGELAKEMKLSRQTINMMEKGINNCSSLKDFWNRL